MRKTSGLAVDGPAAGGDVQALFTRHFVAQSRRPAPLTDVAVDSLHPEQRCLLATDGMVSTVLEAYHLEPIVVRPVSQGEVPVHGAEADWLGISQAATVVRRRVEIRGLVSGVTYVAAESLLVPSRLPDGFGDDIDRFPSGLGAALFARGIESRRELLWFGAGPLPGWYPDQDGGGVLQRTYRVINGGQPISLITESFLR
ncbi:chorismate pyruvate-lyase family protein [Micromonospora sp. CPCC 206060]|uniref:chorismate--pyruvate lyase family protein n=1 Tax=Micromonospora sp. CPCC 206060 TaxID=3122406 RepID=UPI002FEFF487